MAVDKKNGNLPFIPKDDEQLDIKSLETWLWDAACVIRGATDAPKFKDFILPLVFYKRLSDVFDDEFIQYVTEYGDEDTAREIIEADHADALKSGRKPIVRFYIPSAYSWDKIRNHPADGNLGEFITDAFRETARLNPDLQGVLDVKDFSERQSGQRILDDFRLGELVEVLSRHRLGLQNTKPDILGEAYEYLLRKFAEGQGQTAGEFFTPPEVGWLMAEVLNPKPKATVYDPACGSSRLLIKVRLFFEDRHPDDKGKAPRLFGQELNPTTFAIAKMNMFLYDYTDSRFAIGDTFTNPGFGAQGAGLERFDYAVSNPMWNQDLYTESFYTNDPYKRFSFGTPPRSSADWGWVQHIFASLNDDGRAAIVLDTGAVSRGSGSKSSSKERNIRKQFIEEDLIEGVILMPENLFYNTPAPGIILLLNKNKPKNRKGQFILINAASHFMKGKPKNILTDEGIQGIAQVYRNWETRDKLSKVLTLDDVRKADYNLSPSQFVTINGRVEHRPIGEIIADLTDAKIEREEADKELSEILAKVTIAGTDE